jgi:hypothetical protein
LLYGISSQDATTLVAAPALLVAAAVVVTWLTARTALGESPMDVLRAE